MYGSLHGDFGVWIFSRFGCAALGVGFRRVSSTCLSARPPNIHIFLHDFGHKPL